MGDVQQQGQLRRVGSIGIQRRIQHPVIGVGIVEGRQAGPLWQLSGNPDRAVVPAHTIAALDAQRQVGLTAQFILQAGLGLLGVEILQGPAQADQLAFEQLLVQLDEMRLAATAEQHPGKQ